MAFSKAKQTPQDIQYNNVYFDMHFIFYRPSQAANRTHNTLAIKINGHLFPLFLSLNPSILVRCSSQNLTKFVIILNLQVTRLRYSICPKKFKVWTNHAIACQNIVPVYTAYILIASVLHKKQQNWKHFMKKKKWNTTNINESNNQFKCDNLQRCYINILFYFLFYAKSLEFFFSFISQSTGICDHFNIPISSSWIMKMMKTNS